MSNLNPHNARRLAAEEAAYDARHIRFDIDAWVAARKQRGKPYPQRTPLPVIR